MYDSCLAAKRSKLVGDMCGMLLYALVFAVMHYIVCPSLICFLNRGNTEGTNSSQKNCVWRLFIFVFVFLSKFVSGLILWFLGNLWFDDLCAE